MIKNCDQSTFSVEGVFALYKPLGITSQRAVQIVKRWAQAESGDRKIKVGHGGTLDPLAEGVLVIAVGRSFTRNIEEYVRAQKEYVAEITLGAVSTTDDLEGEKTLVWKAGDAVPEKERVAEVLSQFVGHVSQIPPAFSAIKIAGQEAYKRVRRGEEIVMSPRTVEIQSIELLTYDFPLLTVRIVCGKGTYVRSLARDVGATLDTGAHLSHLLRTRVGTFEHTTAKKIQYFE